MDNRALLLQCALDLFAARGYDAGGVQEICEAAGVTKPTLYHYFGSKQGLMQALLGEQEGALTRSVRAAAEYHGDLPLTLTTVAKAYFAFARQQSAFYRLQLAMWFAPSESEASTLVAPNSQEQSQIIESLFLQAVHDHGNMRGRQRAYATTFVGLINTYINLWLNGYVDLNDDLVYRAVHQFQHGIYS